MVPTLIAVALGLLLIAAALYFTWFVPWGIRWGATDEEVGMPMSGDAHTNEGPPGRLSIPMTRAIDIAAPPEEVWPWLAQLGRGAGFYSYDRLDNGGLASADHIVSWIPEPKLGDATAIGYLSHLEPGRELGWWLSGERWLGATLRMAISIRVSPRKGGSRLVMRVFGDAVGRAAPLVKYLFIFIDTLMARRQLLGIRQRVEKHGTRQSDPDRGETGARDQFQYYERVYASGTRGGVAG